MIESLEQLVCVQNGKYMSAISVFNVRIRWGSVWSFTVMSRSVHIVAAISIFLGG